jgi:hypothetical protein
MRAGTKVFVAAVVALWCAVVAPVAVGAPANDDFANAEALGGALPIVGVTRSNVGATKEAGEPGGSFLFSTEPAGHSVWYRWEAVGTEWVTVDTCGSGFDTMLDVYSGGSLPSLERVARAKEGARTDCAAGGEQVTFRAVAGTSYSIRVDGDLSPQPPDAVEGPIALGIAPTPAPANDAFASAQSVTAEALENSTFFRVDVPGFNWNATKEAGEPAHGGDPGGASVWYSWTAPASGKADVVVVSGAFSSQLGVSDRGLLGVYTGSSLGGLAPVGGPGFSAQEVKLDVVAGTTYKIAVDGRFNSATGQPAMGGFTFLIYLTVAQASPPVDTTPLETLMARRSVKPGQRKATFRFRSSEASVRFRCRLDGRKAAGCASPKTYTRLAPGAHTFRVYAVDLAGNPDPTPLVSRFAIPRPHPARG